MSKPKIDRTGEVGYNNDGEKMIIVRCGDAKDISVQFDDGTIIEHRTYGDFKKGKIKNPFFPNVYGVGFIGVGRFKSRDANGKLTKCYTTWVSILERCYSSKFQEKYPTYKGCTVCEEWWNFQNFAEWYYSHYYEIEGQRMNLDKDILHKGNKIYSPNTCVFVPQFINTLFIKRDNERGNCPVGVYKFRDKFRAQLSKGNGKQIYLGTYTTANEAFQAYKQAKEDYIKQIAEKYKSQIPQKLYDALMNYEVEIDD